MKSISFAVVPSGLTSTTRTSLRFGCATFRFTVTSATVNVSLTTNDRTTPVDPTPQMLAAVGALITDRPLPSGSGATSAASIT